MSIKESIKSIRPNTVKSLITSGMSSIIQAIIQLTMISTFNNNWGSEIYGDWITSYSVMSLISVFDFGLGVVIAKEFAKLINKSEIKAKKLA